MHLLPADVHRGRAALPATEAAPERWRAADAACAEFSTPVAVLDLPAFSHNAGSLLRRAGGKPIRVASKSIRSRDVLRALLAQDGYAGVLAFTLAEAVWLAEDDAFTDVVVAYPSTDIAALRALVANPLACSRVTLMVDCSEHLDWLEAALADVPVELPLRLAFDLDVSWRPRLGSHELAHIGVRRSPLRTGADALHLAADVRARRRDGRALFTLVGLMGYEAQIAGVQDNVPTRSRAGRWAKTTALQTLQRMSMAEVQERRGQVVAALLNVADLDFVNGGGTGSLEATAQDPAVTELAAGSGLFGPLLFDGYAHFAPEHAVAFAVNVVRRPGPTLVTVQGGGWIASGPAGRDRLPLPVYPLGLTLLSTEGAGEVQTPLRGASAAGLRMGDKVWFRHAKSGEVCEHVDALELLNEGRIVGSALTYRGEGKAFL